MKNRILVMLIGLLAGLPSMASSMEHQSMHHDNHAAMEHQQANQEDMAHGGMDLPGDMIMLGEQVEEGVKAMVHLKDVRKVMAGMGMNHSHHLMVMFVHASTDKPITEGKVAVKIVEPSGKERKAVALTGMQGHFGADVSLNAPGLYVIKVGTLLPDGKRRQYAFSYSLP
ncbi:MAG: hypothetical protein P8X63_02095 [Desulfuromonadaceae bacterium]